MSAAADSDFARPTAEHAGVELEPLPGFMNPFLGHDGNYQIAVWFHRGAPSRYMALNTLDSTEGWSIDLPREDYPVETIDNILGDKEGLTSAIVLDGASGRALHIKGRLLGQSIERRLPLDRMSKPDALSESVTFLTQHSRRAQHHSRLEALLSSGARIHASGGESAASGGATLAKLLALLKATS